MSTKRVLLAVAAVAVIAIGYIAVNGVPPVGPGTEGTVGAAKRYQAPQIAEGDVQVADAERAGVPPERHLRRARQGQGCSRGAGEPRRP